MSPAERAQVAKAWAMLGEYFRQPLQDVVIGMYVEDVAHLAMPAVLTALRALRVESGRQRCPTPGDVLRRLAELAPDASELAGRITGCIARYGYPWPDRARAAIGPLGWQAVEQFGGWDQLCKSTMTDQIGTLRAQLRDALKGIQLREEHAAMAHRALPDAGRQGMAALSAAPTKPLPRSQPCQSSLQPMGSHALVSRLMGN